MFALADAVAFFGLDSVNMPMIATLISLLLLPQRMLKVCAG